MPNSKIAKPTIDTFTSADLNILFTIESKVCANSLLLQDDEFGAFDNSNCSCKMSLARQNTKN